MAWDIKGNLKGPTGPKGSDGSKGDKGDIGPIGATPTSMPWGNVTGKPTKFPPTAHTHTISNVTGLQTTLDDKASLTQNNRFEGVTTFAAPATNVEGSSTIPPAFQLQTPESDYRMRIRYDSVGTGPGDVTIDRRNGSGVWNSPLRLGTDNELYVDEQKAWHAGNFIPSNYVDKTTDEGIGGNKTFTGEGPVFKGAATRVEGLWPTLQLRTSDSTRRARMQYRAGDATDGAQYDKDGPLNFDFWHSETWVTALKVTKSANATQVVCSAGESEIADFALATDESMRWLLRKDNSSETANDGGSNFTIRARTNTGGNKHNSLTINRGSGIWEIGGSVLPQTDGNRRLGTTSARWEAVYAASGTIVTSDAREKTEVTSLNPSEIAAAQELASSIGIYKWKQRVAEKGEDARKHVGFTVQKAISIMADNGLDPFEYGFICHDSWEEVEAHIESDGYVARDYLPAGDRYSFRYDELLLFISKGIVQTQKDIEHRLAALENA